MVSCCHDNCELPSVRQYAQRFTKPFHISACARVQDDTGAESLGFYRIQTARTEMKRNHWNYLCYKVEAGDPSLSNFYTIIFSIEHLLSDSLYVSVKDVLSTLCL